MIRHIKNLLVPHAGNDFRPTLLERVSVGIMLVLILLSFAIANLHALLWINSDWLVSTVLPSVIVDLTNGERTKSAAGNLARSSVLDRAAQMKAEDMANEEYFSHYSPTGVSPWHWFDQAGYDYLHAGENLAVHFTDSDEVVEAWMDSPSHRANILNGQYTEIGVGTAKGTYEGYDTVYVVQLFGTKRAPLPQATVLPQVQGSQSDAAEATAPDITVEKITTTDTPTDVAPATVEAVPAEDVQVTPVTPEVDVMDVVITQNTDAQVVTYTTELATTSREGVPATMASDASGSSGDTPSLMERTAVHPGIWLQMLYSVLSLIVLVALSFSLALEWRRHHPLQMAYAGGLIAVMAILLYIHTTLTGTAVII